MSRYDDDDDDATTSRGSRSTRSSRYADDDEDERPSRSSRSSRRDDEDDRRRPSRDDDDDDRKSSSRSSSRRKDDDDEDERPSRSSRRSSRDEDDDDRPKQQPERAKARTLKRGWGAADKIKSETSPYANRVKVTLKEQLIKFLEDDPYVSFSQHWIPRKGQQSWNCIAEEDPKGCPLCDSGDTPSARVCFNVLILDQDGGDPVLGSLEASSAVSDTIRNFHNDPKTGPITKHYWSIKKASDKQTATTLFSPIKARDFEEDWPGYVPLEADELADFRKNAYTSDIVSMPTRKQLREIATEQDDD